MLVLGWYRHFKGGYYYVLGEGVHTETRERFVVYQEIRSDILQIRPYDMFIEEATPGVKRFNKISVEDIT